MKPLRTHAGGLYHIYGRDGDEPWKVAPDTLDTSLSLGSGELGAADWEPGLRNALATDGQGTAVPAARIQIALYEDRWRCEDDPPRPQILVLAEEDSEGIYRPGPTVIDGAMWVAAARNAGIPLVPVYVIRPTLPHIEPAAMWLYFNSITNGLAPTGRERARVLKRLAMQARDARGVRDVEVTVNGKRVTASAIWVEGYALATATIVDVVRETTKGIFGPDRPRCLRNRRVDNGGGPMVP
jgi:nucleotide-binding universal stress UspA family protein